MKRKGRSSATKRTRTRKKYKNPEPDPTAPTCSIIWGLKYGDGFTRGKSST